MGQKQFLKEAHKQYGHLGWPGLQGALETRAWWPSIEKDVLAQADLCPAFQATKDAQKTLTRATVKTLESAEVKLFDKWSIDLIDIMPRSYDGNYWIVTAIERATGWLVARAVPDATSTTLTKFIKEKIVSVYGTPRELLSDNRLNLVSEEMESYLRVNNVRHRLTRPYHPQTNGKVERLNGSASKILTKPLWEADSYVGRVPSSCYLRGEDLYLCRQSIQPFLPPFWSKHSNLPRYQSTVGLQYHRRYRGDLGPAR